MYSILIVRYVRIYDQSVIFHLYSKINELRYADRQEILSTTYRRMREEPIQLCVYETEGERSMWRIRSECS